MSRTAVSLADIVMDSGDLQFVLQAIRHLHRTADDATLQQDTRDAAAQQADRLARWLRERRKRK